MATEPAAPAVLLRNVYVPAQDTAAWPTEGKAYLPIDAERLEQLLAATDSNQADSAQTLQAVMYATLDDHDQLVGRGTLEVQHASDKPSWLSFKATRMGITDAQWREQELPAMLGYWGAGKGTAALVKADDWLDFSWHAAPTGITAATNEYQVEVPASLSSLLLLDLEAGQTVEPINSSSLVIENPEDCEEPQQFAEPLPEVAAGMSRWLLRAGNDGKFQFRVRTNPMAKPRAIDTASYREHATYRVSESGVTLVTRFDIVLRGELPRLLSLRTTTGLVVRSVNWNGQSLDVEPTDDGLLEVVLPAPAAADVPHHQLEVEAWSALPPQTAKPLPQVELPQFYWLSGELQVQLEPSLNVADLTLRDAIQVSPAAASEGSTFCFEKLRPRGTVDLAVAHRVAANTLEIGRQLELNSTGTTGRVITLWKSNSPDSVRLLSAELIDGWQPQLVSAAAPYEVDEWYVETHGERRRLVVRASIDPAKLSRGASELKLQVDADRDVPASNAYVPVDTYDILTWNDARVAASWMSLSAEDGYQLQFNPTAPSPSRSAPAELLPLAANAQVFERSVLSDNLQVFLGSAAAEFDTRLVTTVVDQDTGWDVSHRIHCTPLQGSIQRLLLATAASSQIPLQWKLEGEEQWRSAQPYTPQVLPPGAVPGSVMQLELPRRQAAPFVVLIAPQRVASSTCKPQPLDVLGASHATQWVKVRSPEARNLRVTADGWQMSRQEPDDGQVPLHSAWWSDQSPRAESLVVSRLEEATNLPLASIEHAELTSTLIPQVASTQRLELVINNQAESQLVCSLPERATNIRWHTFADNGRPLPGTDSLVPDLVIPLDTHVEKQSVVIEYTMPNQPLRHAGRYTAPWPRLSIPAAETVWRVRTPRSYKPVPSSERAQPIGWLARLFGWLAPPTAQTSAVVAPVGVDQSLHEATLLFGPSEAASIEIVHQPTSQVRQCLWLVLFAAIGYWLWRQPAWLVVLVAGAVASALLLPASICSWGTAALGGLMLAVAVRLLERATLAARQAWADSSTLSLLSATTRVILVLAFALGGNSTAAPPAPTIERCLIPVDSQGRIAGSDRYISARLLSELLRREQQQTESDAWVASKPRYTGSLSSSTTAASSSATVGRWQCELDLDVLQAPATVRLPLHRADATWADAVQLDGVSVPLTWDDAGEWLEFEVSRPGHYRARIEFQPMIRSVDSTWSVQLAVPAVPEGELRLEAGALASRLKVNGRSLSVPSGSSTTSRLSLGCEPRLEIAWPQQPPESAAALLPAEQWSWLDVAADRATLDVVMQIDATAADTLAGELTIDGRPAIVADASSPLDAELPSSTWRLASPPQMTTAADGSKQLRVQLHQDRDETYGRLLLPTLRLAGTTLTASHLAIDESPDLTVALAGTVVDGSDLLTELAQFWPSRDEPSQLLTVDRTASAIVATVGPVATSPRIEETINALATQEQLDLIYRGAIDYGKQETYMQWLSVSPQLTLQSVEAIVDGVARKVDFARPAPQNRLLVLFAEPVVGSCELRVTGSVPLQKDDDVDTSEAAIPRLTAALDTPTAQQIRLYAADSCTAEVIEGEVEPQLTAAVPSPPVAWQVYGVRSFSTSSERTTPLEVRVGNNHVRFDADVLTTMIRRDNAWIAELGVLLTVADGNLPEVVLDWPSMLVGEADVDGAVKVTMETSTTSDDRRLHLRFDPAAMPSQQLRVTLRSAVRMQSPGQMQCPVVHVRDASNTRWYFGELADDAGEWRWQRARPDVAPASVEGLLAAWPSARLLKATPGGTPVGIWTAKAANQQVHELPLATIAVDRTDSSAISLRTQLVVPPLDVDALEFHFPAGGRATQVTIDGAAAHTTTVGENHLDVQLPDPHLPHFVEIVIRMPPDTGRSSVELPQLLAGGRRCEVQHVVWRVSGLGSEAVLTAPDAELRTPAETAALRLNQLLAATVGSTASATRPVPTRWAKRWMAELAAAESDLRRSLAAEPISDPMLVAPEDENEVYDTLLARTTAEIKRTSAAAQLQVGSIPAVRDLLEGDERSSQVFVQSGGETLRWSEVHGDTADRLTRWAVALGVALTAGVYVATRDRKWSLPISGYELLFPAVTLLGVAWWFCLWPRPIGLLLAMAAIVAWIRWRSLARRQVTEEASTITLSSRV